MAPAKTTTIDPDPPPVTLVPGATQVPPAKITASSHEPALVPSFQDPQTPQPQEAKDPYSDPGQGTSVGRDPKKKADVGTTNGAKQTSIPQGSIGEPQNLGQAVKSADRPLAANQPDPNTPTKSPTPNNAPAVNSQAADSAPANSTSVGDPSGANESPNKHQAANPPTGNPPTHNSFSNKIPASETQTADTPISNSPAANSPAADPILNNSPADDAPANKGPISNPIAVPSIPNNAPDNDIPANNPPVNKIPTNNSPPAHPIAINKPANNDPVDNSEPKDPPNISAPINSIPENGPPAVNEPKTNPPTASIADLQFGLGEQDVDPNSMSPAQLSQLHQALAPDPSPAPSPNPQPDDAKLTSNPDSGSKAASGDVNPSQAMPEESSSSGNALPLSPQNYRPPTPAQAQGIASVRTGSTTEGGPISGDDSSIFHDAPEQQGDPIGSPSYDDPGGTSVDSSQPEPKETNGPVGNPSPVAAPSAGKANLSDKETTLPLPDSEANGGTPLSAEAARTTVMGTLIPIPPASSDSNEGADSNPMEQLHSISTAIADHAVTADFTTIETIGSSLAPGAEVPLVTTIADQAISADVVTIETIGSTLAPGNEVPILTTIADLANTAGGMTVETIGTTSLPGAEIPLVTTLTYQADTTHIMVVETIGSTSLLGTEIPIVTTITGQTVITESAVIGTAAGAVSSLGVAVGNTTVSANTSIASGGLIINGKGSGIPYANSSSSNPPGNSSTPNNSGSSTGTMRVLVGTASSVRKTLMRRVGTVAIVMMLSLMLVK